MSSLIQNPDRPRPDLDDPAGPCSWIQPADRRSAVARLAVYTGGYPARVREALEESFPATARVVGAHPFTELAERYSHRVPLRSFNLNDAGRHLSLFLQSDPLAVEFPFLPDLAELEWRMARAFHAAQAEPIDPAAVARWTPDQWEQVVIRFQPWLAVVASQWPIRRIWFATQRTDAKPIRFAARRSYVLVRRAGFAVQCDTLSAGEAHAVIGLQTRRPLGEVLEELGPRARPEQVSRWFARWMSIGAITRRSGPRIAAAALLGRPARR